MEKYYAPHLEGKGLEVVVNQKGKSLFTTKDHKEGDVVYCERRWCGIQNRESALQLCTPTCHHCMRFLGTLSKQLQQFAESEEEPPVLKQKPSHLAKNLDSIKCGCGVLFCSQECKDLADQEYHKLLCLSEAKEGRQEALELFFEHVGQTNDTFEMAARCYAKVIGRFHESKDWEDAIMPLTMFCSELWWKQVQVPDDVKEEEEGEFAKNFKTLASDTLSLLSAALPVEVCGLGEYYSKLFDLDVFGRLLGTFEMNNLGCCARSPLADYCEYIEELSEEDQSRAKEELGDWWSHVEEAEDHIAEGTGLYVIGCVMNHSCEPNVALLKPKHCLDCTTAMIATRDIQAGEELCISYIDEEADLQKRKAALADYLFTCSCSKCLKESAVQ